MRLRVITGAIGTYQVPTMEFSPLCRFTDGAREWWVLEGPQTSSEVDLVLAPATGVAPVAGRIVDPVQIDSIDEVTWINPELPRLEAGELWVVVASRYCVCGGSGLSPRLMSRRTAKCVLRPLLQERPELEENPVVKDLMGRA